MDFFAKALLDWYDQYGRKDLPWQHPRTPYRVWLSEIMLQQTQVATVIPYFQRFLQRFPDLHSLANADLDQVLQLWSGLGYYARARNLHAAARLIRDQFGGKFPDDLTLLQSLPGVGRSTAAAVLSQAFGQRAVIMDGNVRRVLCRYHAITQLPTRAAVQKQLWQLADQHTPLQRPADYTQAIMDLGASLCGRNPDCAQCPLAANCLALQQGIAQQLPARKKSAVRLTRRAFMLLYIDNNRLWLEKRPASGIWGGLLCPPMDTAEAEQPRYCGESLGERRHSFSHFDLLYEPILVTAESSRHDQLQENNGRWLQLGETPAAGMPRPVIDLVAELSQRFESGSA